LRRQQAQLELQAERLRRTQDAADRSARGRADFLVHMSQEIGTPLNGVLGMAQVGYRSCRGQPLQETFAHILDAGRLLQRILADLRDVAWIDAGRPVVTPAPLALPKVLHQAVALVQAPAMAKGLALHLECAPNLPAGCLGDALRLEQVLLNLLTNAIQYTEAGSVTLTARRDGAWLLLQVRDTGIGMHPDQVAGLLGAAGPGNALSRQGAGHMGLGLSICGRLVELMEGQLSIDSRLGAGSLVEVRLPYRPATLPAEEPRSPSVAEAPGGRLAGLVILAVDDTPRDRALLHEILVPEGARLVLVENGWQAVDLIRRGDYNAFDLVLMDVELRELTGQEATRRIRAVAPDLPVIGLTVSTLADHRAGCLAAGMVDLLDKPLEIELLVAKVRAHVPATGRPLPRDQADGATPWTWEPAAAGQGLDLAPTAA
jgi:CheY-like chemotaxis protein/nitrogen-specific signal transduction histidine kinase